MKDKIKICLPCFEDNDLKKEDVEIVSEVECINEEDKEQEGYCNN